MKSSIALVGLLSIFLLAGCHRLWTVDPSWMEEHVIESWLESHPQCMIPSEPIATPTGTPSLPVQPQLSFLLHPLTGTLSLTETTPISKIFIAPGCDIPRALVNGNVPPDSTVRASLTVSMMQTMTVPYLDLTAARSLYIAEPEGSSLDDTSCSVLVPWLWQQNLTATSTSSMSLIEDNVCTINEGYDLATFGDALTEKGEWPELLYVETEEGERAVVFMQPVECGSGSGCEYIEALCAAIFSDPAALSLCNSLCQ